MDSMLGFMDLIILAYAVYALYGAYMMKVKGEIKKKLLLSDDVDLKKCKDLEGYKNSMFPKLLFLGICGIVSCGVNLLRVYAGVPVPSQAVGVLNLFFLVVVVWFAVQTKKSVSRYW